MKRNNRIGKHAYAKYTSLFIVVIDSFLSKKRNETHNPYSSISNHKYFGNKLSSDPSEGVLGFRVHNPF